MTHWASLFFPLSPPPLQFEYDEEEEMEVHSAAPSILNAAAADAAEEDEEMREFRADVDATPLSETLDGIFTLEDRWEHWWEAADKERSAPLWSQRFELDVAYAMLTQVWSGPVHCL